MMPEIGFEVDERTARLAACLLEIFLRDHPEYCLRVLDHGDGTCGYRVVKQGEPCNTG